MYSSGVPFGEPGKARFISSRVPEEHQTFADVQTERVEHGIKIHRAAKRVRMFADALLHQIDDELTHHFVAVRARSDADAADGRTVGGVPASA